MINSESENFDNWNKKKKIIHFKKIRPNFHEREIWFASLGENIGFEENGNLRPVIIIRKFNNKIFWSIPLTRQKKQNKYHFYFSFDSKEISGAILSQMRLIDAKRLQYKVGNVNKDNFEEIKKRLKAFLD
jgi:mRNA interferase MazF